MFKAAKGKYIALCEGDDYWLSPDKLANLGRFLQGNPDYSVCFHPVKVFFENDKHKDYIFPEFLVENGLFYSRVAETELYTDKLSNV